MLPFKGIWTNNIIHSIKPITYSTLCGGASTGGSHCADGGDTNSLFLPGGGINLSFLPWGGGINALGLSTLRTCTSSFPGGGINSSALPKGFDGAGSGLTGGRLPMHEKFDKTSKNTLKIHHIKWCSCINVEQTFMKYSWFRSVSSSSQVIRY